MVYLQHSDRKAEERVGQLIVLDPDQNRIFEGDLRQCVHCQMVWVFRPGSGTDRGFCMKCQGHTCGKDVCFECYPAEQRIEDIEREGRLVTVGEWDAKLRKAEFREQAYAYDQKKKRLEHAVAAQRRRDSMGVSV